MKKSNLILFLLINLLGVFCSCLNSEKEIQSPKNNYKAWLKENFNVVGDKVFLIPQIGCTPCLKQGTNFLKEKLKVFDTKEKIVIVTSDSSVYEVLKINKKTNLIEISVHIKMASMILLLFKVKISH